MRSKRTVYNIVTNMLLQLIAIAYGFIVPKIIIDKFGSDINGLVSSITQFLAYITLLESGFGPVVKAALYVPISKKDNKTIGSIIKTSERFFRNIAKIFILYILVLCAIYPLLMKNQFDNWFTISLIIIIAISTFAEYYFGMAYKLFLQAEQKTYVISIIQIVTYILSILSVIVLSIVGANIHIIKLVSGLIFVARPLVQNYYVRKRYKIDIGPSAQQYKLKQKWDGLTQHIAYVIHTNTDVVILTIFSSLSEISVYTVYALIVKGVKSIIQAIANSVDAAFGDMLAKKENRNLNNKFSTYETLYFIIITVFFSSTLILITPLISVYTKGISDADYNRPLFGVLLTISEYIWAIRLPYSSIVLAAGHFKETKKGAILECVLNMLISIIFVKSLGIIGVAIGTIIAMAVRTIEFLYHANKHILKRSAINSIKKIFLLIVSTTIIVQLYYNLPHAQIASYADWILEAAIVASTSIVVTLLVNVIFYKQDIKALRQIIHQTFKK